MQVTVLWEDQLGQPLKGFGPHQLLLSFLADAMSDSEETWRSQRLTFSRQVLGEAKKGNGNVLTALQKNLSGYRGPVIAVIDRDKAHKLWKDVRPPPSNCMKGLSGQFRKAAPGPYDLIFLVNHTEDLLDAVLTAQRAPALAAKPTPTLRDEILNRAAWESAELRRAIGRDVPSFQRIVDKVARHFPPG
jgi:hypothetical protein